MNDKIAIPVRNSLLVRQTPEKIQKMFKLDKQNHHSSIFDSWTKCLSAVFVTVGLCLRFGGEQVLNNKPLVPTWTKHLVKYTGVILYITGWFIAAMSLSRKKNALKHCIFSMVLVSIIWFVFEFNGNSEIVQPKMPLVSCSMLMSLLLVLILEHNFKDILKIVIASCLILFSEYIVLPYQRDNNINDGLGLPLLLLGWIILFRTFNQKITQDIPLTSRMYVDLTCEEM
jgi:hypothetical protein